MACYHGYIPIKKHLTVFTKLPPLLGDMIDGEWVKEQSFHAARIAGQQQLAVTMNLVNGVITAL